MEAANIPPAPRVPPGQPITVVTNSPLMDWFQHKVFVLEHKRQTIGHFTDLKSRLLVRLSFSIEIGMLSWNLANFWQIPVPISDQELILDAPIWARAA